MEERIITLTPDLAKGYLSCIHSKQRKLNESYAISLARDILAGRWNDEYSILDLPLAISKSGELMNGQHRCRAVVIADRPIRARIVHGVEDDLFNYMDNAKGRNLGQFINSKYSTAVAAIGKFANSIECGIPLATAITARSVAYNRQHKVYAGRTELLTYCEKNSDTLEFCAEQAQRIYRALDRRGGGKAPYGMAIWVLLYTGASDRDGICSFVDSILAVPTTSKAIAQGKEKAIKKIMAAQAERVTISSRYWVGLILAMFDYYKSNKCLNRDVFLDASIRKYGDMIKLMQECRR